MLPIGPTSQAPKTTQITFGRIPYVTNRANLPTRRKPIRKTTFGRFAKHPTSRTPSPQADVPRECLQFETQQHCVCVCVCVGEHPPTQGLAQKDLRNVLSTRLRMYESPLCTGNLVTQLGTRPNVVIAIPKRLAIAGLNVVVGQRDSQALWSWR